MDEVLLMQNMTDPQRQMFMMEMRDKRKNPTTGLLFALFLGGLGAHHFYLGRIGLGIVYLLFCWTFIPAIVAFVELFFMRKRVEEYNSGVAQDLAVKVKLLGSPVTVQP